jgi:hypothetical protein
MVVDEVFQTSFPMTPQDNRLVNGMQVEQHVCVWLLLTLAAADAVGNGKAAYLLPASVRVLCPCNTQGVGLRPCVCCCVAGPLV